MALVRDLERGRLPPSALCTPGNSCLPSLTPLPRSAYGALGLHPSTAAAKPLEKALAKALPHMRRGEHGALLSALATAASAGWHLCAHCIAWGWARGAGWLLGRAALGRERAESQARLPCRVQACTCCPLPPAALRLRPLQPGRGEDARKAVRAVLPPLLKDGSQLLGHALLSWSRRACFGGFLLPAMYQ